jgi:hypothetical protein
VLPLVVTVLPVERSLLGRRSIGWQAVGACRRITSRRFILRANLGASVKCDGVVELDRGVACSAGVVQSLGFALRAGGC